MLTEIKHYMCDRKPEESDIIDAIMFAREWKCIVRINWVDRPYGAMHINITPETSLTEAKKKVFKKYI